MRVVPYGEWPSPLSAVDVARQAGHASTAMFVDGVPWWGEARPAENGRTAVCRSTSDGAGTAPEVVLPAPWNARTRVHEYGGTPWTVVDGDLVFAEYTDQRLYRLVPGGEPAPLTPAPQVPAGERYADLTPMPGNRELLCVRERHGADGSVTRDLCAVPLDGSGADDPTALRSIAGGSHFLAHPRLSPDGRRVCWIAWEHPQMPWDGTELRVADLGTDGLAGPARTLLGSTTESVLQPEWADDEHLYVISDRTGWWNLYRIPAAGGEPVPLCPREVEFGGPLWVLGLRWFAVLPDGRLLVTTTFGTVTLGIVDPATGELTEVPAAGMEEFRLCDLAGTRALLVGGGATVGWGLRCVDVETGAATEVRTTGDELPAPEYRSPAQARVFTGVGGRDVHAFVYPPRHPEVVGPEDARPPYLVFVHGGPTANVGPRLDPRIVFFTSRGLGVVDVNYGGSTGYGRAYRERLRGQWGVVDVEDVVAVARGLVDAGEADAARIGIEGGSAGGWTVLAALTTTDAFACGVSYFGVAELSEFVQTTHDFESRYLDGLIGPLPEARELYRERAPVNNVDGLSCPVLLLQGLDDPVVPPEQAEVFRDALVRKGIPHAYIAYEGESHGFRKSETVVSSLEASLSFYGQVMHFTPPGIPELQLTTE
ncbi:MAG TPA: prolyl oligopeptidase family serine peptidase [Mycobacteriales bacterium]|nr:prolyl oligopeptidase family serine peptidase [Mycobacteriales bacterium]